MQKSTRSIILYLGLVSALASVGYSIAFSADNSHRAGGIMIVQFSPMIAAFLTAFYCKRSLQGFGWRRGSWRYFSLALLIPFALALASFCLVWAFGFAELNASSFLAEARQGIAKSLGITITSDTPIILIIIILNSTVGLFVAFGAIGEEIGWRGFLMPELLKHTNYTITSATVGTIWAIYHFPLIIWFLAPQLEVSAWPLLVTSLLAGIGLTFIMNWLSIMSGSIWVAIVFHASLNIHNQGFFQHITKNTSWLSNYLAGEYGLMLALVSSTIGLVFWFKRHELPNRFGSQ